MTVLYVMSDGFDTENGTNHLAKKTMTTLMENGIKVHLITSHSLGLHPDIPSELLENTSFTYNVIQRKKVEKQALRHRYVDGIQYFKKSASVWKKIKNKFDVVILQSTPTLFWGCLFLRLSTKKPFILNSFDVFPDGPFLFGALKSRFAYLILRQMQKYVYARASKIVVISEDMKNTFLKNGVSDSKLAIIHNWYDSKLVRYVDKTENMFVKKYNIDTQKFIVQYAGNFGYTFDYKQVLEIAERLVNKENIQIHLIGTGGFEKEIKNEIGSRKLKNVLVFPWQPMDMIADVYSSCDIGIIALSKGVIYTSFPSKCALLMACKKPFLCLTEKDSVFYKRVNNSKIGICVESGEYDIAACELQKLADNKDLLWSYGEQSFIVGQEQFSSDVNAIKYVELVESIFKEICGH